MKIITYVMLLRPHQWLKNLLLLFPPFFAGKMAEPHVLELMFPALLSFSLMSSVGYIFNDIKDVKADMEHGTKRNRMIARGDISVVAALLFALVLVFLALIVSSAVSRRFEWLLIVYLVVTFLYTIYLKEVVISDIFMLSFGYLIRVLAGGEAFHVGVSKWLFLTVFIVSLLLAAGKRLGEMVSLGDDAHRHRKIFSSYSSSYLEGVLWFSASATLVTYALYTFEHQGGVFYTVPLVAFGLLRYIFIAKNGKGDPTDALLKDRQIMIISVVWISIIGVIVYT